MSAPAVRTEGLTSRMNLYSNTVWKLLPNNQIQLTSVVKGETLTCRLNLSTLEKARKVVAYLIEARIKSLPLFHSMTSEITLMPRFRSKITFIFIDKSNKDAFKTVADIPELLGKAEFTEEAQGQNSEQRLTYVINKIEDLVGFTAIFVQSSQTSIAEPRPIDGNGRVVAHIDVDADDLDIDTADTPRSANRTPSASPFKYPVE
jgi:hypothetical protein